MSPPPNHFLSFNAVRAPGPPPQASFLFFSINELWVQCLASKYMNIFYSVLLPSTEPPGSLLSNVFYFAIFHPSVWTGQHGQGTVVYCLRLGII